MPVSIESYFTPWIMSAQCLRMLHIFLRVPLLFFDVVQVYVKQKDGIVPYLS